MAGRYVVPGRRGMGVALALVAVAFDSSECHCSSAAFRRLADLHGACGEHAVSADDIFSIANTAVLPGWLMLLVAPRAAWTHRVVIAIAVVMGLLYLALFVSQAARIEGSYGSLAGVIRLFENPYLLVAGWVHYLAFDLFIGSWEVQDARRSGVPHLAVVPCLVLTFLFGPVGLLAYLILRRFRTPAASTDLVDA